MLCTIFQIQMADPSKETPYEQSRKQPLKKRDYLSQNNRDLQTFPARPPLLLSIDRHSGIGRSPRPPLSIFDHFQGFLTVYLVGWPNIAWSIDVFLKVARLSPRHCREEVDLYVLYFQSRTITTMFAIHARDIEADEFGQTYSSKLRCCLSCDFHSAVAKARS